MGLLLIHYSAGRHRRPDSRGAKGGKRCGAERDPGADTREPKIRNWIPETRLSEPPGAIDTRIPDPDTRNPDPEIRSWIPGTRAPDPETRILESGTRTPKPEAGNLEPGIRVPLGIQPRVG